MIHLVCSTYMVQQIPLNKIFDEKTLFFCNLYMLLAPMWSGATKGLVPSPLGGKFGWFPNES